MKLFAPSKPLTGPLSQGDRVEIDPEEPWEIEEGETIALLITPAVGAGVGRQDGEVLLGTFTTETDRWENEGWRESTTKSFFIVG